jgi:hypothetical protein
MKHELTIEIETEADVSNGEVQYIMQKMFNQIEQFDGFKGGSVVSVRDSEAPEEGAKALYEMLGQIDTENETLAEQLEKAQEIAWRMAKDDEFMESDEDE